MDPPPSPPRRAPNSAFSEMAAVEIDGSDRGVITGSFQQSASTTEAQVNGDEEEGEGAPLI